jgi:hypothetical protein
MLRGDCSEETLASPASLSNGLVIDALEIWECIGDTVPQFGIAQVAWRFTWPGPDFRDQYLVYVLAQTCGAVISHRSS